MSTEFTPEEASSLEEGGTWPRFLLFPALAIVGYFGFASGWGGDALWVRMTWSLALGYCWFCVGGCFHESVHQTMGPSRNFNIWFGRVVGTFLGIPYSAYRETHIRHHAYMNTPDDYELWPYAKPSLSLTLRRAFLLFDLFGAVLSHPVVYGRIYFKRDSNLSRQAKQAIGREYIAIAVFWGTILGVTIALHLAGQIDLSKFDPMLLLPMPIASIFNTFRKFTEHLGMASTDPILGTRTVLGKGIVTRLATYFNFDEFIHGPHHRYPRAPGIQLEAKLAEFRRKNPDVVIPIFTTYRAALWDMLPWMLYPGIGQNAGGKVQYHVAPGAQNFVSEVGTGTKDADRKVA